MVLPSPSCETKLSGAIENREIFIFPVQLTTSRIGNLIRLIHTLLSVMTIHTRTSLCCLSYAYMRRDRRPKTPRLTRYTLPFCVFFLHPIISHLQSCATFFRPRNFYIFKTFFLVFSFAIKNGKIAKTFFKNYCRTTYILQRYRQQLLYAPTSNTSNGCDIHLKTYLHT